MEFKVKKGVSLPPIDRSAKAIDKYPFNTMAVGDLFFVPDMSSAKFAPYVSQRGRKLGKKFSSQSVIMRQDLQTDEWELCKEKDAGARRGVAVCRIA